MNEITIENIHLELAAFKLSVKSTGNIITCEEIKETILCIHTANYKIEMHSVSLPLRYWSSLTENYWTSPDFQISFSKAWLFYITKTSSSQEELAFSIELSDASTQINVGPATGQWLIAVELEDGVNQVHIGAEDEDALAARGEKNDWMPPRLVEKLQSYTFLPTQITEKGLVTTVSELEFGERFYFHYIIAEEKYRKSLEYPDEVANSSWMAVEQSKYQLEKAWQSQNKFSDE